MKQVRISDEAHRRLRIMAGKREMTLTALLELLIK